MFDAEKFIKKATKKIKEEVKGKALIAFSGGVDSAVCAALVNKAISNKLIAIHAVRMRSNGRQEFQLVIGQIRVCQ